MSSFEEARKLIHDCLTTLRCEFELPDSECIGFLTIAEYREKEGGRSIQLIAGDGGKLPLPSYTLMGYLTHLEQTLDAVLCESAEADDD